MATETDGRQASEPVRERIVSAPTYGFPTDEQDMLTWDSARQKLIAARSYWLATTRPDGRPHVTPLWGVWVDDSLYFDGLPTAIWARNISTNPHASLHLESGDEVVIVDGSVDQFAASEAFGARIVDSWMQKYGQLAPEPGTRVFRLTPSSARAWSSWSLSDGTRWRFDARPVRP